MELMLQPLRKYADFEGRARRSEFWLFALFCVAVVFGLSILSMILSVVAAAVTGEAGQPSDAAGGAAAVVSIATWSLIGLFLLAMIIPGLAVRVRRLHDIGCSGWFILIGLIPGLGGLALFVMSLLDGTSGPNEFGPDPKAPQARPVLADTFS